MFHFTSASRRVLFTHGIRALLGANHAQAHHGWAWAESEQMTLQGQIERISMAPPHPP